MKLFKSKLDEMQDKEIKKIESIGLYITFAALIISLFVQMILCEDPRQFYGEFFIVEGLCVFMVIGSLKAGVWNRFFYHSFKTHFLASFLGAAIVGIFVCIMDLLYGAMYNIIIDILIFSGITFAISFIGVNILYRIYKKRRQKLDSGAEYQELAAQVGVTVQTLKAIDDGTYNPSIKLCRKICRATGKTLDELFWKEEENF